MSRQPITRRSFMGRAITACAAGAMTASQTAVTQETAANRPNLVFIFSDQQSWDMLGCYGNKDLITPCIDRFAAESIRFNHCVSNSPVCTPYRGILMSGQHPFYCGSISNDVRMLPGDGAYLGEALRDHGYRMGYYGKWHLYGGDRVRPVAPGPLRYGFDHEFLTNNCTLGFDKDSAYYWDQEGQRRMYGDWEPYAQTRQAMEFVDNHSDKPFALFLSWHPPHNWGSAHAGYDAPDDCLEMYDPAKLTLRPNVEDTPVNRMIYQGHMAMITSLDQCFGRLMDQLKTKGLADNTIVVFTSDHGDMLMSYGWSNNKGRPEHGSCRVPLLIRWPERLKPGVRDDLFGTFDFMPTLLGLMGLAIPETCQGKNFADTFLNGSVSDVNEQPLFFLPGNWRGIYTRRYTYSYTLKEDDNVQPSLNVLFDRDADPWELKNLFGLPEYAAIQNELHARAIKLMDRFGDTGQLYGDIARRCIREDDFHIMRTVQPQKRESGWECRLRGRPVDVMRNRVGVETN